MPGSGSNPNPTPTYAEGLVRITEIELEDRLLLLGPPGIGKTERIRQLAEEEAEQLGKEFVDVRQELRRGGGKLYDVLENPQRYYLFYRIVASHVFPEDLSFPEKIRRKLRVKLAQEHGVSEEDVKVVEFTLVNFAMPLPMMLFALPGIHGVLFVDEITNLARKDQESMWFSVFQEKEIAWTLALSENVKVVAAGNPPEVSGVANPLSAPLINRMIPTPVAPATVDEWINYMIQRYGDNWDRRTAAYLKAFPEDLYRPPEDVVTLQNFPTPRGWTRLSLMLKNRKFRSENFKNAVIIGILGPEVGARVIAFLQKQVPKPEEIIEKPEILKSLDIESQYLALASVAEHWELLLEPSKGEKLVSWLATNNADLLVLLMLLIPVKKGDPNSPRPRFYRTYLRYFNTVADVMAKYAIDLI